MPHTKNPQKVSMENGIATHKTRPSLLAKKMENGKSEKRGNNKPAVYVKTARPEHTQNSSGAKIRGTVAAAARKRAVFLLSFSSQK